MGDQQTRGLTIGLISYGYAFSECHLELVIRVSWDNCIQLSLDLVLGDYLYQLNTHTYLTDQYNIQYVVILTLCCNKQALLTLNIIVIFTVKIEL